MCPPVCCKELIIEATAAKVILLVPYTPIVLGNFYTLQILKNVEL